MKTRILKTNQKKYIWNFLEAERMISYHTIVFCINAGLFISIIEINNDNLVNLIIY